jgi:hypothetical protein
MRRIEFSAAPRADVALLKRNLEFWPVFREIVSGFSTIELETIGSPVNGRDVAPVVRGLFANRATLGYASMAARFRKSGARVLLASDQASQPVNELGRLVPMMHQILIAHGSQRREHLRRKDNLRQRANRVLCVWGQSDVDLNHEGSEDSVRCLAVGSLRNAAYLRLHPLREDRATRHELLFVSQYSGQREDDPRPSTKREQILWSLKSQLCRYCTERSLPLTIALRPPVSAPHAPNQLEDEMAHYARMFAGVQLTFTDPGVAFASYKASDETNVTVGVPGGALTESFGRGNKVLMFRQSPESGSHFGFPVDGPWLVTEPTYDEFATSLENLRRRPRIEVVDQWRQAREFMLANAESDAPLRIVRDYVTRSLNGESV